MPPYPFIESRYSKPHIAFNFYGPLRGILYFYELLYILLCLSWFISSYNLLTAAPRPRPPLRPTTIISFDAAVLLYGNVSEEQTLTRVAYIWLTMAEQQQPQDTFIMIKTHCDAEARFKMIYCVHVCK